MTEIDERIEALTAKQITQSITEHKYLKYDDVLLVNFDSKKLLQTDKADDTEASSLLSSWVENKPEKEKLPLAEDFEVLLSGVRPNAKDLSWFPYFDLSVDEMLDAYFEYRDSTPYECSIDHDQIEQMDMGDLMMTFGGEVMSEMFDDMNRVAADVVGLHFNVRTGELLVQIASVGNPATDEIYIRRPDIIVEHMLAHMPKFLKEDFARKLIEVHLPGDFSEVEFKGFRFFYGKGTEGDHVDWTAAVLEGYEMTEVLEDGSHAEQ